MGFKMPVIDLKAGLGFKAGAGFKETVESLWQRRPTEYVDHDGEPPAEWSEAVRPSGATANRAEVDGIEVIEQGGTEEIEVETQPTAFATVVETHFRIRCECGRRWWAIDLSPTTCPRCQRVVAIQSAV